MASDDKPIFVDLDKGIIGRFDGVDKHIGDPGLVFPKYFPFGFSSFFGGAKKYDQAVREVNMHTLYPKNRDIPGTPDRIVIIFEDREDSLMNVVRDANKKRIEELERAIDDLRLELAGAQQRAESAQAGTKKLVSEAQEITKAQRQRSPFDGFGFGPGGQMPPYGGGGDGDFG